jgi:hypothetical protein
LLPQLEAAHGPEAWTVILGHFDPFSEPDLPNITQ